MTAVPINRLATEGLHSLAQARGCLRSRNHRRRRAAAPRRALNEQAWREAAAAPGASWRPLGSGFFEVELDGQRTRATDNMSAIDDPVTLGVLHDKPLTRRILRDEGLPVPRFASFTLKETA